MPTISAPNADIVLLSTATPLFMAGAGLQFIITKATITNTDTNPHTVTVYRVPLAGTAGTTNIIGVNAVTIAAGATMVLPLSGQTITNSQSLQAIADTGAVVNFNLSLIQVV